MASYIKKNNGTYDVRFRWINQDGREVNKRITTMATTKSAAEREYIKFVAQNPSNQVKSGNNGFTSDFLTLYIKYMQYKKPRLKESSYYDFGHVFEKHIIPEFEKKAVYKITKLDILYWQEKLNSAGYSYKYKKKLRGYLFNFFIYCNRYHDIQNVVSKVEPFVKPKIKKQIAIWELSTFQKFLSVIDSEEYKTFFMLLYYTGARLGEALALNYLDFNFNFKTITISKSLSEKTNQGAFIITTPKNVASQRVIELPNILLKQINDYATNYPQSKTNKFFFGNNNLPLATTSLRRNFKQWIIKSNVQPIRLHDFRHSHASMLISLGANIVLISKRLGHSDTQITLNTYSHLLPKAENEIITKLNNLGTL